MGSKSDWGVLRETGTELDRLNIGWRAHVASAHRSLARTLELVRDGERGGVRVFICGAGMAAHLAGVVAAATTRPVIGVPLAGGVGDGLDALLSTVQMPGGVPVATVAVGKAGARNAAVLAAEILALSDSQLEERLRRARTAQVDAVAEADATLDTGRTRS
ncbi:MAG: 5-(carboxyamino)imidazole ribonucleotide mutase [Acidobacteria bacterium RBG_13_68_16]|nr:MAG: 5-(carboxyamino)imidazole ribonucleotide mutase [Acidobacteria bacterium RBG_13_68_16]